MRIIHTKSLKGPGRGSMTADVWYYRTEVLNDGPVPIRVVWFEFYFENEGNWFGVNKTKRVLQHDDFRAWFSDGEPPPADEWIRPGEEWASDPNWHLDVGRGFYEAKWAFLAVDRQGEVHFAEAIVPQDACQRHSFDGGRQANPACANK